MLVFFWVEVRKAYQANQPQQPNRTAQKLYKRRHPPRTTKRRVNTKSQSASTQQSNGWRHGSSKVLLARLMQVSGSTQVLWKKRNKNIMNKANQDITKKAPQMEAHRPGSAMSMTCQDPKRHTRQAQKKHHTWSSWQWNTQPLRPWQVWEDTKEEAGKDSFRHTHWKCCQ